MKTVTFIEGYNNNGHIDDYTPYTAIIGFPSNVDAMTLFQQSTAISHELGHHAIYCRFGEWKYCNNSIHFLANQDLVTNRMFRKGMLKSYRMVYFRLDEAIKRKAEIELFCSSNEGHPQPYWA